MMSGKYGLKSGKSCKDYACPSVDDIRDYFSWKPYRIHKYEGTVYSLGDYLLRKLGHGDIIGSISIKDLDNMRVEIVMFLARRMAVYTVVPQQYGHNVRNIIAASLNAFSGRLYRFRSGHKLPTKTRRQISKANLERLISELCEHSYLWLLAERWEASYKWRLSHGYCEPI